MKIKTLVVDDDHGWRLAISKLVGLHPALELVATCASAIEAYTYLTSQSADLLICDIEMPDLSGLGLARQVTQTRPLIIFVTAHQQYALDCYEVSPVDFLLKPLQYERFMISIDKVRKRLAAPSENLPLAPYFFVKDGHDYVQIAYDDVLYMKAQEHFVKIVTRDRTYLPLISISKLEEQLKGNIFLRTHRSYMVHRLAIAVVGRYEIKLTNGESIPIGEQYRASIDRLHIDQHLLSNRSVKL